MMRPSRTVPAAALAVPAAALLALWPAVARADMVWPGILLEGRLLSRWAVGVGLLLEAAYLWLRLGTRPAWRAFVHSVAVNAASAALGLVLIPLTTFASIFPVAALRVFGDGFANAAAWAVTLPVATAVNVVIESWALRRWFDYELRPRLLWELGALNALTIALAMASLWVWPVRT